MPKNKGKVRSKRFAPHFAMTANDGRVPSHPGDLFNILQLKDALDFAGD